MTAQQLFEKALPPHSSHPHAHQARLLGGMLLVGTCTGLLFELALIPQNLTKGVSFYAPKICLYLVMFFLLAMNRRGHYRFATYTSLIAVSFYGASLFYFGTAYQPVFCAMLTLSLSGILLKPLEALGILCLNLLLWMGHAYWGDGISTHFPVIAPSFAYDTLSLFLYGLVILALQGVVSHFLQESQARLEKARQTAEQATQAKSIFLAQMSHELRTPVAGVIGLLELTLKKDIPEEAHEELIQALRQAEIQLDLINDLLDISKIEAGRLTLENIAFNTREWIQESLFVLQQSAKAKRIGFSIYVSETLPPWIIGDTLRLRQILVNLVTNAIKFTESGQVSVAWSTVQAGEGGPVHLKLEVRDTGIGITPENQQKLFSAFEQGGASTARRFGGSGLGLAISKGLAKAMDGEIRIDSRPGQGTAVQFTWPCLPAESPAEKENAGDLAAPKYRMRVLLVEDVAVNRHIAQMMLKSLGQNVDSAKDGEEACRILSETKYDMVLMDLRMPVMDGMEATKCIRRGGLPKFPVLDKDVTIIALTANTSHLDRDHCLAIGMNGFLTKPLREQLLRQELCKAEARQIERGHTLPSVDTDDSVSPSASWTPAGIRLDKTSPLMKMWRDEAPKRLAGLRASLLNGDLETLSLEAHNLKGAAGYLELSQLKSLANDLEKAADKKMAKDELEKYVEAIAVAMSISLANADA